MEKYYLDFITKIEPMGWREINGMNCRTWYHVGENFLIEAGITEHDRTNRNDLTNLWVKHGHLDRFLPTTAHIQTYYTDKDGKCSGLYNIQHKRDNTIDFTYMLEATPRKYKPASCRMYQNVRNGHRINRPCKAFSGLELIKPLTTAKALYHQSEVLTMKYFNHCKTIEEAKSLYKELVKKYHPDIAGAEFTAKMQEINAEFERAFELLKNRHAGADNTTYTAKTETAETATEFMNIINKLIHCDGLTIELVGRWIWLTGNTYAHREVIKSLAFRWSHSKKAWYWRKDEDAGKNRRHDMTLDEIKDKYGCETFATVSVPRFAH